MKMQKNYGYERGKENPEEKKPKRATTSADIETQNRRKQRQRFIFYTSLSRIRIITSLEKIRPNDTSTSFLFFYLCHSLYTSVAYTQYTGRKDRTVKIFDKNKIRQVWLTQLFILLRCRWFFYDVYYHYTYIHCNRVSIPSILLKLISLGKERARLPLSFT